MIVLDTSGVLAWIDPSQRRHGETVAAMSKVAGPFLLSPFVLAELDYLVATRVGRAAQRSLLLEVERGAYRLEPFAAGDIQRALQVIERFGDLDVGLADASIVVLAERHRCRCVLTLDERHFRVLRSGGRTLRLLPSDA